MTTTAFQPSLDDIGTPLSDVTFVVVDLETTGGSSSDCAITEIGAVKVRGGEVLGEFATLVNPGGPIPATIQVLTGITTAMVITAPPIGEVLPSFLEFARGAVLVAHNAPFDMGFLKAACRQTGQEWPRPPVLDTVRLARRVVTRDEARNHKLSTLAALFGATVTPSHRALADAQATVDVLHALLARLAPMGVTHLEDLATAADPVPDRVRRKHHMADALPDAPGVYLFNGPHGEVLYIGTSVSLRRRVRQYFTASEPRRHIREMVSIVESVTPVVCATALEARIRELRLIAEHKPRYNRQSRHPERASWVRLTDEPYPRLSVVRQVKAGPDGATLPHIGPFSSAVTAQAAVEALHATFPIRRCTRRLPAVASASGRACMLAEIGACGAPCIGAQDVAGYQQVINSVTAAMTGDPEPVVASHAGPISAMAAAERFEEAAALRDRVSAYCTAATRAQRLHAIASCRELVAARRLDSGGWEILLVRYGRMAATTTIGRGEDPWPAVHALQITGEHVPAPVLPSPACLPAETELVIAWLESEGTRIVVSDDGWASPVHGAQRFSGELVAAVVAISAGQATAGSAPAGHAPTGHAPAGHAPAGLAPTGHAPAGLAPTGLAPTGLAPAGLESTRPAPIGQAAAIDPTAAQAPAAGAAAHAATHASSALAAAPESSDSAA